MMMTATLMDVHGGPSLWVAVFLSSVTAIVVLITATTVGDRHRTPVVLLGGSIVVQAVTYIVDLIVDAPSDLASDGRRANLWITYVALWWIAWRLRQTRLSLVSTTEDVKQEIVQSVLDEVRQEVDGSGDEG